MSKKRKLGMERVVKEVVRFSCPPMAPVSWSDLPEDLLELIFKHTNTTDILNLCEYGKVCQSWLSVIKKMLASSTVALPPLLVVLKRQQPLNNNPRNSKIDSVNLFNIFTSNSTSCEVPKFKSRHGWSYVPMSVSTSKGWLVLSYRNTNFHNEFFPRHNYLYNPLSRVGIWLPLFPSKTYPPCFILSSKPTDPSFMVLAVTNFGRVLLFWKPGYEKWRHLRLVECEVAKDIIHYKGEFYAISNESLLKLELSSFPCTKLVQKTIRAKLVQKNINRCKYLAVYLVESSNGDLLMVRRILQSLLSDGMTCEFEIYKLNWERSEWDEITSLGDEAIFLAENDSFCIQAGGSTGFKQNCIYFTRVLHGSLCFSYVKEYGMYDLGTQTINQFSHIYMSGFNSWFKPDI